MRKKLAGALLALGLAGGGVVAAQPTEAATLYTTLIVAPKSKGWCPGWGNQPSAIKVTSYTLNSVSTAGGNSTWIRTRQGDNKLAIVVWCTKSYPMGSNPTINVQGNNWTWNVSPNEG